MNINQAFPSKYLKASDLGGGSTIVTLDHVTIEEVGQQKDKKLVAHFVGKDKGFVLNKTNATRISQIASTVETDDWKGLRVMLYATETEFQGETVETIRVKAVPPTTRSTAPKSTPPPPAQHDDDVHSGPVDESDIPF